MDRFRSFVRDRLGWVRALLPGRLERLLARLVDRDLLLAGSSLAFYGLVSLLPLLLLAFALLGNVAGQDALTRLTRETAQTGDTGMGTFVGQLSSNSSSLSWLTVLAALWPATAYGGGLRRALTRAAAGEDEDLPGLRGRLLGLGLVFALPILVLAGMPLLFALVRLSGEGAFATALGWLLGLAAVVLVGAAVTTAIYHAFAPEGCGLRESLTAAGLVAGLTAVFSLGFVLYLRFGQVEERFGGGTTAAVVLMGVWLFVANVLLLAGYEAATELADET